MGMLTTLLGTPAQTFDGSLTVSGAAVMKTTLNVLGATTLSGAATLKGVTTLEAATVLKTTLSVEGATTLSGAATLKSTLNVTGAVTPNSTAGIVGTTTNDSVNAGGVGEVITSAIVQASGVSLTTTTAADVTSISLTAGDWDVMGNVAFVGAAGTTVTESMGWVSATSATAPAESLMAHEFASSAITLGTSVESFTIPYARFSLASTTTVYLSVKATFAVNTLKGFGQIFARRAR